MNHLILPSYPPPSSLLPLIGKRWLKLSEIKQMATDGDLGGAVTDVLIHLEKLVRTKAINLERDLIQLPPPPGSGGGSSKKNSGGSDSGGGDS